MSRTPRRKSRQGRPSPPTRRPPEAQPSRERAPRGFTAVAACLCLSGAASLMLEVVWTRLLRLVFGSTTLAVSTILVAYMLGLGLGGLLGGRIAARLRNGVRTYGWVEVGIGCYAACVPWILDLLPILNRGVLSTLSFWPAVLSRFVVVLFVLLLPTLLMGATLPILVAALVRGRAAVADRVGLLYGLNTLGAVSGVFLSTFVLFPAVGVRLTNLSAAALDLLVGLLALAIVAPRIDVPAETAAAESAQERGIEPATGGAPSLPRWNPALLAYGLVGFTAMVYEVCWTRTLSLVLGSSIYAFATMLAAFLTGIALGSLLARRRFDALPRPLMAYGFGLAALGALSLGTLLLFRSLPQVFVEIIARVGLSRLSVIGSSVGISMLVMLGPTLVLGALFPLLTRAVASAARSTGTTVGDVYFINTLGSAAGAFLAGFVLIPGLGVRLTLAMALAMNFATAAGVLLWQRQWSGRARTIAVAGAAAAAAFSLAFPPTWSQTELTRGVYRDPQAALDVGVAPLPMKGLEGETILYYRDGINTTVSVHRIGGELSLRVNGKADASSEQDMPTQVLLGQLPMIFGPPAARVLVIGLASGVTVGCAALHDPERIDVVELEPAMLEASHFFDDVNNRPLERANVHVIADDARNYIEYTREQYDVIISEPSNPWITGASSLFTREFFAATRRTLRPNGRLFQWVQLYGLDPSGLRAILAALHAEFPYVYGFTHEMGQPDLLLAASGTPLTRADFPVWERLPEPIRNDLRRVGNFSTADVWSLLRFAPRDIEAIVGPDAVTNSDTNMFVELHAPWALNDAHVMDANWQLLSAHNSGVVAVLEQLGPSLDADTVGEIALSYAGIRQDLRLADELVRKATARGSSANALVAEAVLLLKGNPDDTEALTRLDQAVAMRPDAFAPHLYRGRLLYTAERAAAALADADAALGILPGDLRARYLRLEALNVLERPVEARAEADALLASSYALLEQQLWQEAARAAAAVGRYDDGIRELLHYLERNPNWPVEWTMLATMYDAAARPEDARDARTNAERADRNLVLVLHQMALRALRLGSTEDAIDSFKGILVLDPKYEPARQGLRQLGVRVGDSISGAD